MARKFFVFFIPVFAAGFITGNAFWYLASPLWIDVVVDERLPDELSVTRVATGTIRGADSVHKGSGTATLSRTAAGVHIVSFSDFNVTNGPDLKVILVKAADPQSSDDVKAVDWISLGPLKGNIGAQSYVLGDDIDPGAYQSVAIWCKRFGVLFASASLAAVQ